LSALPRLRAPWAGSTKRLHKHGPLCWFTPAALPNDRYVCEELPFGSELCGVPIAGAVRVTQAIDFGALRACFLPPIPELDTAADLLGEAADALLAGNHELARERLRQADMAAVFDHAQRIMGPEDPNILRKRTVDLPRESVAKSEARMPSADVARSIYARDGWRCRYCGSRVVLKDAQDRIRVLLPGAIRSGRWAKDCHAAFRALRAVPDHVIPHAIGGGNKLDNLVTACWPCNFGRMGSSLEEVGLIDPRSRPAVVDGWDGLGRVLGMAKNTPSQATTVARVAPAQVGAVNRGDPPTVPAPKLDRTLSEDTWFSEIDRIQLALSSQLLAFVESCADLGVSCSVNNVMIVRMKVNGITIQQFGIESSGEVNIPWLIAGKKKQFRKFAEAVAEAIPGAVAIETRKQWVVKKAGKRVNVLELLDASKSVRVALEVLNRALQDSD